MDPSMGRGRGLALLEALKKRETPPSSQEPTPNPTPSGSQAPSVVSSTSTLGGRGRLAMMFANKQLNKPGEAAPILTPASDVSSSLPPARGAGRGIRILESLKAQQARREEASAPSVSEVTEAMTKTSISKMSVPRNKPFREVKDSPPVVMKGETGNKCNLTSNFIYLNFEENNVFEYDVSFQPNQDQMNLRFKLLNEHRDLFKTKTFDGTTLYVPHRLPDEAETLVSTNPYDDSKVTIKIAFRRLRRLSEMVHIYNVLFKQIMKDLELVRFNRQHFNQHAAIPIPQHKLEVWPGYVTAVDEYEGGLMLTLDSTHRVLRTQSVLSLIKETVQHNGANWKNEITNILVGCSVMTSYNKKLFRVDTIDDTMTPRSTFEKNEGGQVVQIYYYDYYKKNYGIEIKDLNQPMLISRDTKRMPGNEKPTEFMVCLVPELCQLTGLTDDQRSNFKLMKDVAMYTRITPNQRHSAFKKYIENVMSNPTAVGRLKGWGLSLNRDTIDIVGRTLPPEDILFGNGVVVQGKPSAEWNFDATKQPVLTAVDIMRWAVLFTKRDQQVTSDFIDTLRRCCNPMGIKVQMPEMIMLPTDKTDSYIMGLKKAFSNTLQLVVAICPTARDDRYAAIKKICCSDNPIPSQVINSRTIMNQQKLRSITQKILLQMNCKLGGTLWGINMPIKMAMIVGIDSYHDASRKKRSVFAFVASYNKSQTLWYSRTVFQEQGQEIVDSLKACMVDSLNHYLETNGCLPEKIIIYRDGVGDGQLKIIRDYEVAQMMNCYSDVMPDYKPTLTYIIVQKRINTRIFLKKGREFENPAPGTVVDHDITRRDWYDFLLVSQKVNQGTVTPTHFIVLYDDSGLSPDKLQRLTYKMCHLYYNWPGTVRVPAPCQYAHKLAYLVGQNTHAIPSIKLSDKLFFL